MRARNVLLSGLLLAGLVTMAVLIGGCASGVATEDAAEVLPATEVAVVPTPQPTAAPTPVPTAVLQPAPTIEPLSDEEFAELAAAELDEIRAVHTRFMTELFARDESTSAGVEDHLRLAEELTAEDQLATIRKTSADRRSRGEYVVSDGFVSNISAIDQLEDHRVRVFDCSLDTGVIFDSAGTVIAESPAIFEWRSTALSRLSDRWVVVSLAVDWNEECDPDSL